MTIQDILDEVDELNDIQSSMTLISSSEPHQKEWEDEWELQGYTLPISVGTELYWDDGTRLRGLYMTVPDRFTLPTRWSKLMDNDPGFQTLRTDPIPTERNIWVRWWLDDTHLIGTGTYDGVTGTYKMYMDGSVELITTKVAVNVHPPAQNMVVQDGSDLKLYDLATDTLGATIDTVSWTADLYGPVKLVVGDADDNLGEGISEAGWGFTERIGWADETDLANLDFYYIDGDEIHFYEDGVGSSLLFSVPSGGNDAVTICFQNDLLAISYESITTDIYHATIFDLTGTVVFELGVSGDELGDNEGNPFHPAWGTGIYRAWHFRKTPDSTTLMDVLQPEKPVRAGVAKRIDPTIDSLGTDYIQEYGTHTWEKYLSYDTVENRYIPQIIYDSRLAYINTLGEELTVVASDTTTQPDVVINDRHRWAASLISNRKQGYTFVRVSPDGNKVLFGWGESFGIKSRTVDKLAQGPKYGGQQYTTDIGGGSPLNYELQIETGRHGSVVLALEQEGSTGRVYRISDYAEPFPTELVLYSAVLPAAANQIFVDLEDIIADLDPDYELLKVYIETAGPDVNTSMFIVTNAGVTGDNRVWKETGGATSSAEHNGLWRLLVGGVASSWTLTFHNFRSNDTYLTMFAEGGAVGGTNTLQLTAAGYIDVATPKPLNFFQFEADSGNFNEGNRVVVSALRTRGKYSNGVQNDYSMA